MYVNVGMVDDCCTNVSNLNFWDMSTTRPKGLTQSPTDDIDICLGIVNRLVRPEGHDQSDITNGDFTFEKRHGI